MYSCSLRPSPPLKNTFIKVKSKSPNIPTTVYVFFLTLLYGFGLDFGFKKLLNKEIRIITKWFQIFITLVIIVTMVLAVTHEKVHYLYSSIISYILHYLFLYRAKYTVYDLIIDVHMLIDNKTVVVKDKVDRIIYIFMIITFVLKYPLCNLNYILVVNDCQNNIIPVYLNCIPIVMIDGIVIILIVINYYIYIAVKHINESTTEVDTNVSLDNFIQVADCWDKIRPLLTRLVSLLNEFCVSLKCMVY